MDEFAAFVVFSGLVVLGIFLAIGKWYPGSGAEQVDWKLTRSPEVEAELEIDDVDQMIEAQNERRRRRGEPEITEREIRERVAADRRAANARRERYLEQEDVEQMLEAKNARRRARGLPEITEEDYRAQIARELGA